MEREKIYATLHKLRGCVARSEVGDCSHRCKECICEISNKEVIDMCDTLIAMYRPKKRRTRHGA